MNRQQNRSRSRDNYGGNNSNHNRPRNNDNRRRDDFDRNSGQNSNRYQGGGGRRDDQGGRMPQMNRGMYGMNTGYSQNMGMYGGGQQQMGGYGGTTSYGTSAGFQQNRFGVNQQQQMINPWANNVMPTGTPMGTSGDEAKLAMNILNAVLSSGPESSGRGMSPPPNKMRRMDFRDGGYEDRRRRPRSPPGRSHQNRQQFSQRFGSDRRGRDGQSSYQRNDDHRFRNSFSKSPGVSRSSSRQSSEESTEFVFRKRLSFEERERESKKFKDLPAKALKCRMCEKSTFHNVSAYLAHVDSKGHNKVARAFHEKIAATGSLLKHNARLALQKEIRKAKATDKKIIEKECRLCEGPMVYGNLKHKNILACKILHKYHNQTLCCGKDHKSRSLVEEHCLSLAHLQTKFETESQEEETDTSIDEKDEKDENMEDEEEKMKRLKRDEARRKRKYGDDETDEEEDEEEEEDERTKEKREEGADENAKTTEKEEVKDVKTNGKVKENNEGEGDEERAESNEKEEKEDGSREAKDKEEEQEQTSKEELMETSHDEKKTEGEGNEEGKKETVSKNQTGKGDGKQENKDTSKDDQKDKGRNRKKNNKSKLKRDQEEIDRYQGKTLAQLTFQELLEFHKKSTVDDPEKMCTYDPALPTGLNYIDTRVCYHCMACLEYCPALPEDLKSHSCSKDHYALFRSKYMKVKGVRDTPTSLKKLKNAAKKDSKEEDKEEKEGGTKEEEKDLVKEKQEEAKDKPSAENEDVGGDDALYDPYEGESGDLTAMLQEKETPEENEEAEALKGYEIKDEAHESEAENYEDNILDYDEDVAEDEDKVENKGQVVDNEGDDEGQEENEEDQEGEEEEEEREEKSGDVNNEGEEPEEKEECQEEEYENDGQEIAEQDEEDVGQADEEEEDEDEDEEASAQPRSSKRGQSRRAF